ncbi:MAG TPA: hypothetical protein VEB22_07050 [Phycisphaerales bacterium]|nr:hypothetical protein [Phycisphaerales bacterium]
MNLPSIKPQSLIAAAALLAPMALVQTVRMAFGSGPSQANASVNPVQSTVTPPPAESARAPIVTPKQRAAIEHLASRRDQITIYTSPFNHLVAQGAALTQPTPSIEPTPGSTEPIAAAIPPEVRALSLGALMANDHGPFAVISGKVRTIGDVVVPGWTLTGIDPEARRVTVTSDAGTAVILTQHR